MRILSLLSFSFVLTLSASAQLTVFHTPTYELFTRVNGSDADNAAFNVQADNFYSAPDNRSQLSTFTGDNIAGDVSLSTTAFYNSSLLSTGLTESASASYSIGLAPGGETHGLVASATVDPGVWGISVSAPTWVYLYGSMSFSDVNNNSSGISFLSVLNTSPFTITTLAAITSTQTFSYSFLLQPGYAYHLNATAQLERTIGQSLSGTTAYSLTLSTAAPVPEPATYAFILGLIAVATMIWQRRARN